MVARDLVNCLVRGGREDPVSQSRVTIDEDESSPALCRYRTRWPGEDRLSVRGGVW